MAITDIPEFLDLAPGGLIRSEDWNSIQRQARNSVRSHRHTRVASEPANDASTDDVALQITTDEIADQAVTANKLANGAVGATKLADQAVTGNKLANDAVSTTKIQDGAITNQKLQANAVDRANIRDGAINRAKLAFQEVTNGTVNNLAANGGTNFVTFQTNLANAQAAIFFPLLTITAATGAGFAEVEPAIVYRRTQATTGDRVDVLLRLRNNGAAAANVSFRVLTFAP
jgi:hypothetical protein